MADETALARLLALASDAPIDPDAPPVSWRRRDPLFTLMGPPDYVHAPKLRTDALPDLAGTLMRHRVEAAQSPRDRWFDDHDKNISHFVHQATGLVPGLHAAENAWHAWADPEHPVTQEGRSIPKALGWGALGLAESVGVPVLGRIAGKYLTGAGGYAPQSVNPPEAVWTTSVLQPHHNPGEAIPSIAGSFGLGANRKVTALPDPESVSFYNPYLPGAIRPQPRRDALANMAPPQRPLEGLKVHNEPVDTYHGTEAQFDRFDKRFSNDFGIHSGTRDAAKSFIDIAEEGAGRLLPMRLGPQDRPFTSLEVRDLDSWQPLEMARELERRGVRFSDKDFADLVAAQDWKLTYAQRKARAYPIIEDVLNRHNVDVLRYKNLAEDPGSTSWITWNPETLYSRTTGAQLYGAAPAVGGGSALAAYLAGVHDQRSP